VAVDCRVVVVMGSDCRLRTALGPIVLSQGDSDMDGVVVSVLATGPKGCGFDRGQSDGILRAIRSPLHKT
jgi:hypothetical protein